MRLQAALLPFVAAVTLLLMTSSSVSGARILSLLGTSGKSHNNALNALLGALAARGHDITVYTAYPLTSPPAGKYRQIDCKFTRQFFEEINQQEFTKKSLLSQINFMWRTLAVHCPIILDVPEIKDLLKEKFDLVIVSMFFNECFIPFAHYNGAPLILFSPAGLLSWVGDNIGNPAPTSYVPNVFLPFSQEMNIWERTINTFMSLFLKMMRYAILLPVMNQKVKEFFGPDTPLVEELERNASLMLVNRHVSYNYPQPFLPNIIEVGGMHISPSMQKLTKDLQDFMDGAKDGVIYFSLGSVVRPEDLPPQTIQAFVEAFSDLPQRVLWKWNLDQLPGGKQLANVKLNKWLPQQAVLEHPNLRLFITHGGLLSTQEASHHGVPLVGVPLFGDQKLNMRQSELLGFAIGVDPENVSKDTILAAVNKIMSDPSFKEKALTLKRRIQDQSERPLERAIFWTEYVLRHKGAPHLRSAATRLAWYELHLLDVAAIFVLALVIAFLTLRKACRALRRICCGGGKANLQTDRKKKKN